MLIIHYNYFNYKWVVPSQSDRLVSEKAFPRWDSGRLQILKHTDNLQFYRYQIYLCV